MDQTQPSIERCPLFREQRVNEWSTKQSNPYSPLESFSWTSPVLQDPALRKRFCYATERYFVYSTLAEQSVIIILVINILSGTIHT